MSDNGTLVYQENEVNRILQLETLFKEWVEELRGYKFLNGCSSDDIVCDGFYPFYANQKIKILFIGRESLDIAGCSYIKTLHDAYKQNRIGEVHINRHFFHSRLFYITYGLNEGGVDWSKIPYASDLTEKFATSDGISFAFMNLSKISNESGKWQADWNLIDEFARVCSKLSKNYLAEEINIVDPDIIITMNLGDRLTALGRLEKVNSNEYVSEYKYYMQDREIPLIDTFHFSAIKNSELAFYKPIISAIIRANLPVFHAK